MFGATFGGKFQTEQIPNVVLLFKRCDMMNVHQLCSILFNKLHARGAHYDSDRIKQLSAIIDMEGSEFGLTFYFWVSTVRQTS